MKTQSIVITPELLNLIAEIDEFRGRWSMLHDVTSERLIRLSKMALLDCIGSSSRMEGMKLSNAEIATLLKGDNEQSFEAQDKALVTNYAEVIKRVFERHQGIAFTEDSIKQLHSALLQDSGRAVSELGDYKRMDNHIEAFAADGSSLGVMFRTTSPFETPQKMKALVQWVRESLDERYLHPLLVIAVFIVSFLAIQPFQSGNRRLSRVLTVLLLMRSGYSYLPYSSLERVLEQNKDAYYLALRKTQETLEQQRPDWNPWLHCFMRMLKIQKDDLASKMNEDNGRDGLPLDSLKVLDYLSQHGRMTMKQAEEETKTPRATLKLRFKQLIENKMIVRYGKGRGTWYALPRESKNSEF